MKWDWIFFDADETLFTFDSFSGLQRMFLDYSVTFYRRRFSGLSGREQAAMGGLPKRRHHLAAAAAPAF